MKNWLTQVVGFCAAIALISSCKKDETRVVLQPLAAPTLTASTASTVLLKADAAKPAVTYTWTPADYGYQAAVTYTLQIDKKGGNFSSAQQVNAGSATSKTFSVSELNDLLTAMKLPVGQASQLDVRVKASVSDNVDALSSAVASLTATPYESRDLPKDKWSLIGPAGISWDTDVPMDYDFGTQSWVLTTTLKAEKYKFRANKDWGLNLGGDGTGKTLKLNGDDLMITDAGKYTITMHYDAGTPANSTYSVKKN